MGREARGVRGVNLREGDKVVGMSVFGPDATETLLTVCENGYGKRTALSEYPTKNRGGYGVITIKTTERNGPVCGIRMVGEDDDIVLISNKGKLIRMNVAHISIQGRATQGVRVMRIAADERVVAVERLADKEDEDTIEGDDVSAPSESEGVETVEAASESGDDANAADAADAEPGDGDAE